MSDYVPTVEDFERRALVVRESLPRDFGDGWMSQAAKDMLRIAIFAGFNTQQLVQQLVMRSARNPHRKVNVRTVEAVLDELGGEA